MPSLLLCALITLAHCEERLRNVAISLDLCNDEELLFNGCAYDKDKCVQRKDSLFCTKINKFFV